MDPWDDIDPYASSSGTRYGDPVSSFGTSNRTNADPTSRCMWGQADKPNPQIHNLPLSSAVQEGELNCSHSAQSQWSQWGKTNNHVGGISCASTKNSLPLHTRREQRGSYWCQWKNEEVTPSDTHRKGESSYRSPANNKNGCNSKNNVAAERVSDLPGEIRLECQRSLFDIDYEAETKLQTRNYHSGGNHNNVAESKLKNTLRYDRLDHVNEIKSDYDNLPEITLQERDRWLAMKDNSDNKEQPEKREESVGTRTALVPLVPGGATMPVFSVSQTSEIQKSPSKRPRRKRVHIRQKLLRRVRRLEKQNLP